MFALILCAVLGASVVSTLGDTGPPALCADHSCTILGGAQVLFKQALNKFSSGLRAAKWVLPMSANSASIFGCSYISNESAAAIETKSAEDIKGIFV